MKKILETLSHPLWVYLYGVRKKTEHLWGLNAQNGSDSDVDESLVAGLPEKPDDLGFT